MWTAVALGHANGWVQSAPPPQAFYPVVMIQWPDLPAAQQPDWPDAAVLDQARSALAALPPLVFAGECDLLTDRLAKATTGEAFVLQAGDCAETFAANTADSIRARLKTVLQMAIVLTYAGSVPVIKVGRLAGQFAKPRSNGVEHIDGQEIPAYRGDAVNSMAPDAEGRIPDPTRLVQAYHASSAALNLVRAFTQGGYADLHQVHAWNQDFVRQSDVGGRYDVLAQEIDRALAFMHACGADPEEFRRVEFYASHEALLLDYEKPLTRIDSRTGNPYDVSAHMVWIGDRTRQIGGAHIDFAERIHNPIGVKVGPTTSPDEILELVERLNPQRIPGRLTLITRMGAGKVREALPSLVQKVDSSGVPVVWMCDPMHGNTKTLPSGRKTREFEDVMDEVTGFFEVHGTIGTIPGGLHVELTGDDVTECLGGGESISEADLDFRYETACDPRLNRVQSLELAFRVADLVRTSHGR
jgi:3-deoxy-7-phosphoheptulonate synthase